MAAGRGLLGLTLTLGLAGAARAHELGTIRTYADFRKDGTWGIEVFIDREHLPPGFAASPVAAARPIRGLTEALARDRSGWTVAAVANASHVFFDGREVGFEAAWKDPNPSASEPVLRLTGEIPPGASSFAWKNDLSLGT